MYRLPVFDGRPLALDETAEVLKKKMLEQEHEANVAVSSQ
jgi:hypothetical protein